MIREDHDDRIYRTEREKWESIIEEIKRDSATPADPVLVGTTSVEKSEMLSADAHAEVRHRARGAQRQAARARGPHRRKAGQQHATPRQTVGNVTIATNMAGRGTDIKLQPIKTAKPSSTTGNSATSCRARPVPT